MYLIDTIYMNLVLNKVFKWLFEQIKAKFLKNSEQLRYWKLELMPIEFWDKRE